MVSLADYFEGGFSAGEIYFSLMAFLIVVGLFMSYGYLYNHVIDRNRGTNGKVYLLLHVAVIVALNDISVSLEYMRNPEVNTFYNHIFIDISFIVYYIMIFLIARRAELVHVSDRPFVMPTLLATAVFVTVVFSVHEDPWISIAVTAAYVLGQYAIVVYRWRRVLPLYPGLRQLSEE